MEKKMKRTNLDFIQKCNNLFIIMEKEIILPYPVVRAIVKNHNRIEEELKTYEVLRKKIIGSEETEEEKEKRIKEILEEEIEIEINTIKSKDIEAIDTLTIRDISILDFMIEE